jgi:hypothetical protein
VADGLSRRDFVIVTGSATAALGAPGLVGARAHESEPTAQAAPAGGAEVRHERTSVDAHAWTDVHARGRLELTRGWVVLETPHDAPLKTSISDFRLGAGHDRVRAALGDPTLQHALAVASGLA